jgi:hypothetical protein
VLDYPEGYQSVLTLPQHQRRRKKNLTTLAPGETASPNLRIWKAETGTVAMELVQRKAEGWCPQWSKDEKLCCVRSANNEAFFYAGKSLDK